MSEPKPVWVAAYFRNESRVLVRQRLIGKLDLGMWGPPGGHCEAGELQGDALVREVREETGLEVVRAQLCIVTDDAGGRGVCFLYRVLSWRGLLVDEPERNPWQWTEMEDLQRDHRTGQRMMQPTLAAWLGCDAPCTVLAQGVRA